MTELNEIKQKILPILKSYGVTRAGLFGSYARGDYTPKSDIDLLVEIKKNISLFDFIHIEQMLEDILGKKVDLVEYETIKPRLRERILREEMPIL